MNKKEVGWVQWERTVESADRVISVSDAVLNIPEEAGAVLVHL